MVKDLRVKVEGLEKKAGKLESLTASLETAEKKLADSITGSVPTSNVSDDWNREIAKAPSSQVKDVRFEDGPELHRRGGVQCVRVQHGDLGGLELYPSDLAGARGQ